MVKEMLIVFKREDKSLYESCEGCKCFVELKDDPKQYPKTVGVICNAPQTEMAQCYTYDWYRAVSHYHGERVKPQPEPKRIEPIDNRSAQEVLRQLRRIGKK